MRQILHNAWIEPIPETVFKLFRWIFSPFKRRTSDTQKPIVSSKEKIVICISISIVLFSCVVLISLITGNDIGLLNSIKDAALNLGLPVFSENSFRSILTENDISILDTRIIQEWETSYTMLTIFIGFLIIYFVEKNFCSEKLFINNFCISYKAIIINISKWILIFVSILFCEKTIPHIMKYLLLFGGKGNTHTNNVFYTSFMFSYGLLSFCLLYVFLENYVSMICKIFIVNYVQNEFFLKNFIIILILCLILDFIFDVLKRIPLIDTTYRSIFNYIRSLLSPKNYTTAAMFFITILLSLLQDKNR